MRLKNKVALVTGAGGGIGAASCKRLAEEGAVVIATDISGEAAATTARTLSDGGLSVRSVAHNVADEDQWIAICADIAEREGRLDIVVNNAGTVVPGAVDQLALKDWERVLAVNLTGTFLGCKHGVLAMTAFGNGGSIINISSVKSMVGSAGFAAYDASKGGVRALSRAAALRCAENGSGIRVNALVPGYVNTNLGTTAANEAQMAERKRAVAAQHPIGRLAEPSEIADAVVFLASAESSFITASDLVVDGGFTAQ